jgi:hypothetical protein
MYLETAITNCVHDEIARRLHYGNTGYCSVQKLLQSRPLYKALKNIKQQCCQLLYYIWVQTQPLTLREWHKLRMF